MIKDIGNGEFDITNNNIKKRKLLILAKKSF